MNKKGIEEAVRNTIIIILIGILILIIFLAFWQGGFNNLKGLFESLAFKPAGIK